MDWDSELNFRVCFRDDRHIHVDYGTGIGPTQSDSVVNFYGATATTITSWSDTAITTVVPVSAGTGSRIDHSGGHNSARPCLHAHKHDHPTHSLDNMSTYLPEVVGGHRMAADAQGSIREGGARR